MKNNSADATPKKGMKKNIRVGYEKMYEQKLWKTCMEQIVEPPAAGWEDFRGPGAPRLPSPKPPKCQSRSEFAV